MIFPSDIASAVLQHQSSQRLLCAFDMVDRANNVIVFGERQSGKSTLLLVHALANMINHPDIRVTFMAPTVPMAWLLKPRFDDLIIRLSGPEFPNYKIRFDGRDKFETTLTNGSSVRFTTVGQSLKGVRSDGIYLDDGGSILTERLWCEAMCVPSTLKVASVDAVRSLEPPKLDSFEMASRRRDFVRIDLRA